MNNFIDNSLPVLSLSLNGLSLICSLSVLMVSAVISRYYPKLMDRVTIRLQIGITISDALRQFLMFITQPETMTTKFDYIMEFLKNTLMNLYCILNIAIAVNIFLLFILGRRPNPKWETSYWKFCIVSTILLNVPSLLINLLGTYTETNFILRILYPHGSKVHVYLIQFLGSMFGMVIVIVSLIKLRMTDTSSFVLSIPSNLLREYHLMLREYMRKSILFPLGFFICSFGSNIIAICSTSTTNNISIPPVLIIISVLGQSSTGILNSLAFIADPSIQKGFQYLYRRDLPEFLIRIRAYSDQSDKVLGDLVNLVGIELTPLRTYHPSPATPEEV